MTEKLLTVEEVAQMLNLRKTTIYQLVWKKRIPCIQISKKAVRFDPVAIRAWLNSKAQDVVQRPEPITTRRRGRPRKDAVIDRIVERIVESAKEEALK